MKANASSATSPARNSAPIASAAAAPLPASMSDASTFAPYTPDAVEKLTGVPAKRIERLAHDFEDVAAEIWQLIEKENTVVGQRHLA